VKGHDIRLDLEAPPDQQLFDLGSNPDAIHRSLAVKILIERCSKHPPPSGNRRHSRAVPR
jgi:hypothetical protein